MNNPPKNIVVFRYTDPIFGNILVGDQMEVLRGDVSDIKNKSETDIGENMCYQTKGLEYIYLSKEYNSCDHYYELTSLVATYKLKE